MRLIKLLAEFPRSELSFDNGFSVTGSTGIITATGFSGPLTGGATGLSGSPDITVPN